MPLSNKAFAVRGSGPDRKEASACGQHWRLGHVDLTTYLRPLQHYLLGGIQARPATHRAVQAQLITKVQPGLSQPYSLFFRPWTNKLYPEYTLVIPPWIETTNANNAGLFFCWFEILGNSLLSISMSKGSQKAADWQRWIYLAFFSHLTSWILTKSICMVLHQQICFKQHCLFSKSIVLKFLGKILALSTTSIDIGLFAILWKKTKKQRNILTTADKKLL